MQITVPYREGGYFAFTFTVPVWVKVYWGVLKREQLTS
jgi:hypothetical protein